VDARTDGGDDTHGGDSIVMKRIPPDVLRLLCESIVVNPLFQPKFLQKYGLITQCNRSAMLIAGVFDCLLSGTANQMCKYIRNSPNWRRVDLYDAAIFASQGAFVVALEEGMIHGHVVVCAPGKPVWSGKWSVDVPLGANIGKSNFFPLRGINWAFRRIPDIFVWDDSGVDKYGSGLRPKT